VGAKFSHTLGIPSNLTITNFSPLVLPKTSEAQGVWLLRNRVLTHNISVKCFVLSVGLFYSLMD
jgi:hypothetical protein